MTVDLFMVVYRTYGSSGSRRTACYHLSMDCPVVQAKRKGQRILKGRLGAMLVAGRVLCQYEARHAKPVAPSA